MLRSFRLGEADRVLHLYTLDRGRVGAVAKGVRKTKSRFGARLEPLSHVELMLHQGGGELQTVTGVHTAGLAPRGPRALVPPERRARRRRGDAAPLPRAGGERACVPGADAVPRSARRARARRRRPTTDPLVLSFQLKLLWLSGYLPHVTALRRVRGRHRARRLLAARRRRGLRRTVRPARCRCRTKGCSGSRGCCSGRSPRRARPA